MNTKNENKKAKKIRLSVCKMKDGRRVEWEDSSDFVDGDDDDLHDASMILLSIRSKQFILTQHISSFHQSDFISHHHHQRRRRRRLSLIIRFLYAFQVNEGKM